MQQVTASSASELVREHGEFLTEVLYPLFSQIGINVSPAMGGPIDIRPSHVIDHSDPTPGKN